MLLKWLGILALTGIVVAGLGALFGYVHSERSSRKPA